jgi:hypothetical protein
LVANVHRLASARENIFEKIAKLNNESLPPNRRPNRSCPGGDQALHLEKTGGAPSQEEQTCQL